jgi:hypothetical protein
LITGIFDEHGLFIPTDEVAFKSYLKRNAGKVTIVYSENDKDRRSGRQNRLYWLWLGIIADVIGTTKEIVHWLMKCMFLGKTLVTIGTKRKISGVIPKSSADLDVVQFKGYMDQVYEFAHDNDIPLPIPEAR